MEKFAEHAWGELGVNVVRKWSEASGSRAAGAAFSQAAA
jgi:hypothetical protein